MLLRWCLFICYDFIFLAVCVVTCLFVEIVGCLLFCLYYCIVVVMQSVCIYVVCLGCLGCCDVALIMV